MARTGRFVAVMALAAVPLTACANQDADRADVVDALEEADASRDQADCVADGLTDQDSENVLSQDELNDLADANDLDDLDEDDADIADKVRAVMDQCFNGEGSSDEGTTETTEESTTTTEG